MSHELANELVEVLKDRTEIRGYLSGDSYAVGYLSSILGSLNLTPEQTQLIQTHIDVISASNAQELAAKAVK